MYLDGEEAQEFPFSNIRSVSTGYNVEGQYLFHSPLLSSVLGGGYYELNSDRTNENPTRIDKAKFNTWYGNGYVYTYLRYPEQITWILGASFDSFHESDDQPKTESERINEANWKLGLVWKSTQTTTLRLAAFRVFKRSLIADQTIEPTQVAGFNQFFDDPNATVSQRYGIGLDQRFSSNLYGGIELSRRDLKVPDEPENWRENLLRTYLYWTPHPNWALNLEYEREDFDNFTEPDPEDPIVASDPPDTVTQLLPFEIAFYDASGFFASLVTTYVNQQAEVQAGIHQRHEFVLVDTAIGYRLPKRYGILSVGVRNMLDEDFNFQSLGSRTQQDESPLFVPERTVFAQITLSF